jgi:hypothetical protein
MISTSKPVSCEAQQLSSETIRLKLLQRPVPPHPLFRFSVSTYNLSSSLSGQTPRLNNLNRASIGASSLGGHLIALKVDIGFFFFSPIPLDWLFLGPFLRPTRRLLLFPLLFGCGPRTRRRERRENEGRVLLNRPALGRATTSMTSRHAFAHLSVGPVRLLRHPSSRNSADIAQSDR